MEIKEEEEKWTSWLAQFAALSLFERFYINCLAGECVCVRGDPWSTRVEEERR